MPVRQIIKWLIVGLIAFDVALLGSSYFQLFNQDRTLSTLLESMWANTTSGLSGIGAWVSTRVDDLTSRLATLSTTMLGIILLGTVAIIGLIPARKVWTRRRYSPAFAARRPIIGLVAAKNPVSALIVTVESLFAGGASRVVVVDDGSDDPASIKVFDDAEVHGAEVIHMAKNVGKSNALRAGFSELMKTEGPVIIAQVDDDTYAGDLTIPAKMIGDGKADIVDVRVETFDGTNFISRAQQLDYWLINATIKRFQDWVRARLWLSGASMLYTSEAAQVLLMEHSVTQTEDTEGRYRAVKAGLTLRYCSSKRAQFKTMVPERFGDVHHQWRRWAIGNGQVIGVHGFGGGSPRIALVNILSWLNMFISPVAQFFVADWIKMPFVPAFPGLATIQAVPVAGPLIEMVLWMAVFGLGVGVVGSIMLRRASLLFVGVFIPVMSLWWTYVAVEGICRAIKQPRATSLTWTPPKRMETPMDEVPDLVWSDAV